MSERDILPAMFNRIASSMVTITGPGGNWPDTGWRENTTVGLCSDTPID